MKLADTIWHKHLRKPHRLHVSVDRGHGVPIIFLHGLGAESGDWAPVTDNLDPDQYRIITIDLLGFGRSPKPNWKKYTANDHASSVIKTLRKIGVNEPVILVGHSMGAIVAARITRRKPKLVKQLILYELPVYIDLPAKDIFDIRHKAYLAIFDSVLKNPKRTMRLLHFLGRIASDVVSITLDPVGWLPFEQSLRNTVMGHTVYEDLNSIQNPVDVVYGTYDLLIVKRSMKKLFRKKANVTFHQLNEGHRITAKTGRLLNQIAAITP